VKGGNVYATTINVLVSAVIKIARAVRLPTGLKLYRGLGGDRSLPPSFQQSDLKGRRGMLEWGFMSTTSRKEIAIQYSGILEGKPIPTIFEIDSGAVDRGAILTEYSQYPGIILVISCCPHSILNSSSKEREKERQEKLQIEHLKGPEAAVWYFS
jgi:hypothetical protein